MEQIRNEIALINMEMDNYRNVYGFGYTTSPYDWYEIDVPVEDREHYRAFYRKFCNSLENMVDRKFKILVKKRDELYKLLQKDFEPHTHQRYFDPKMFPSGSMVSYDYSGGLNHGGVDYIIVKATKTYLMGYMVTGWGGDKTGETRKFATKPIQIRYIEKIYKN
jgi:hypothetical protein